VEKLIRGDHILQKRRVNILNTSQSFISLDLLSKFSEKKEVGYRNSITLLSLPGQLIYSRGMRLLLNPKRGAIEA
jgi:hypothetical protein